LPRDAAHTLTRKGSQELWNTFALAETTQKQDPKRCVRWTIEGEFRIRIRHGIVQDLDPMRLYAENMLDDVAIADTEHDNPVGSTEHTSNRPTYR
jgi:hypothetical protein